MFLSTWFMIYEKNDSHLGVCCDTFLLLIFNSISLVKEGQEENLGHLLWLIQQLWVTHLPGCSLEPDTADLVMNRGETASCSLPSHCKSWAVKQNKARTAPSMSVCYESYGGIAKSMAILRVKLTATIHYGPQHVADPRDEIKINSAVAAISH